MWLLEPECIFRQVASQRVYREPLGPRPGWVPIYCGVCAKKYPGRPPPIIGEGTGRTVATEFRDVTLHVSDAELEGEFTDEEDFGMSPEELLATATTWTKPYGELHQYVKDGPRVSVEDLRADIKERMPYLNDGQVEAELEDALGRRRSNRTKNRLAFVDVEIVDGRSALRCWVCEVSSQPSRKDLARKIDLARKAEKRVLISPGGIEVI